MTRQIIKRTLNRHEQELTLPNGAKPIHVSGCFTDIAIWFDCDADQPQISRKFIVVYTHTDLYTQIPANYNHVGSLTNGFEEIHIFSSPLDFIMLKI